MIIWDSEFLIFNLNTDMVFRRFWSSGRSDNLNPGIIKKAVYWMVALTRHPVGYVKMTKTLFWR